MGAVSLGGRQCPGPLLDFWLFLRALWCGSSLCLVVLVRWCSGSGDLDWSFFFFDSRLLSVLGGSWMLADVALGCGWSAVGGVGGVGGVGDEGGGGGGGGGDGGGVVLAGKVVAVAAEFNKRTYSAVLGLLFMLLYA